MNRNAVVLLLAGAIAVPRGAAAQDTAAVRDSIAAVADTAVLRRMASTTPSAATAAEQLRRGFASLRLFELTGTRAHAERAQHSFQRAHALAPADVYAQLGLGLSLAAIADAEDADPPRFVAGRAFAAALGIDARARARRALERTLELEPALADAAAALADIALRTRDADALAAARAALLSATASGSAKPATWLARARVALALDDPADASAAARSAAPAPAAGYVLAVALLRTAGREHEGARAYFSAAARSTESSAALFADELRELWNEPQRLRWDSLDAAGRHDVLRRFWDVHAGLAGVTVAERLAEHQRRIATAFVRYRRKTRWGAPPANALLLERPDGRFDDRGVIFVRHGAPLEVIRTSARAVRPNESWVYRDAGGERFLLHFAEYGSVLGAPAGDDEPADRGGFADYVLLYELPCAPDWVGDRVAYDHRLNPLLRSCSVFDRKSISIEVRRAAYAALASDSDAPRFDRDLAFAYQVYAFRGAAGATDLVAAASIAAADLDDPTGADGRSIALALIVVDTAAELVARADTIALSAADTLLAYATLRSPPVTGAVVRVIARDATDPRHGQLRGGELDIPAFDGDTLMISDVVIAAPGSVAAGDPRAWSRGHAVLRFAPGATFATPAFRVFFEIYNLEPGAAYSTEIRVEPRAAGIGGMLRRLFGARPPLRLRFEDVAATDADGVVRVLRDVRAGLPPGRWTLHVSVTGPSGVSIRRARTFDIADPH